MKDDAAEVRRLLSALRDRPLGVDEALFVERRERLLPGLQAQVRTLHRSRLESRVRRRAVLAVAGVAVAAAAAVVVLVRRPAALRAVAAAPAPVVEAIGSVRVEHSVGRAVYRAGGSEIRVSDGELLPSVSDAEFLTESAGSVRARTEGGLVLALSENTRLAVGGLSGDGHVNRVRLARGEVKCEVPKLEPGKQFEVVTPDARVVVQGTVFSVKVTPGAVAVESCVRVEQGIVVVYHAGGQVALNNGESWGCAPKAPSVTEAAVSVEHLAPEPAAPAEPVKRGRSSARAGRGASQGSTLAAERELLQAALAAEGMSESALAADQLRALLERYPNSPLAPEARNALARILRNSGER